MMASGDRTALGKAADAVNSRFETSYIGRYWKVKERQSTLTQEFRAGSVGFLVSAFILAVNASIIADTGGICVTDGQCPLGAGSIGTAECDACVAATKTSLITATGASALIGCLLMAVLGNMPVVLAPGLGLNAYFAYTVVGFYGSGHVSYRTALAAVFIEGIIFVVISAIGLRTWLIKIVPRSIWVSCGAGIGAFLSFIGLQASNGLGVVTYSASTAVALGGCTPHYRAYQYTFADADLDAACVLQDGAAVRNPLAGGWSASGNYECASAGVMRSGQTWLGIFGGILTAILMAKGVRGALMIGILSVTFISWIPTPSNRAAYLGPHVPGGEARMHFFKKVVAKPDASMTAGKFDFGGFSDGHAWLALITFLYVDLFDATATMYSMATFVSHYIPNFIDAKTKTFERQTLSMCVDGAAISIGACLGTSPVTAYTNSAAAIREGGRTGITALVCALWFFVALFFNPLLASIPGYATGPSLILVGAMMMIDILKVDWENVQEAVPAFLTFIIMPLTYSVAYGVIAGVMSWILLNGFVALWNLAEIKVCGAPAGAPEGASTLQLVRWMTFDNPRRETEPELDLADDHHENPWNDEVATLPGPGRHSGAADASVSGKEDLSTHSSTPAKTDLGSGSDADVDAGADATPRV